MNCSSPEFLNLSNEILAYGNRLRFQARGESMNPFIRNGDILEIEPIAAEKIKWADVIFYRVDERRLVAHRVVKKVMHNHRPIFITKGDANIGQGEQVHLEQILGRVRTVERNQKKIDLNQGLSKLMYLCYLQSFPLLKRIAASLLPHIQGLKLYRNLARRFLSSRISYQWQVTESSGRCLLGKRNDVVIARVTVLHNCPQADSLYRNHGWWISGMWVHWRYRRLGIGRQLAEKACNFAGEQGGHEINLLVFRDNKPARALYQKMGFYPLSIPRIDEQLKREAKETGRQKIILKKDFHNNGSRTD